MSDTPPKHERDVKVWDLPTRIFHWLLAVLVIIAIATQEAEGSILWMHVYSGTLLVGFVVFRLLWGVIGSRHALFKDFVYSTTVVKEYTKKLFSFRPPYFVGHNPLGGWVVVLLIALTLLASISGLMVSDDGFYGPLSHVAGAGLFGEAHEGLGSFLMTLVIIHIVGVVAHGFLTGENLPRSMVNGVKKVPAEVEAENIRSTGIIRPLIALAIGVAAVWPFL